MKKRDEKQFHHIESAQTALAKASMAFLGTETPDWESVRKHVDTAAMELADITIPIS